MMKERIVDFIIEFMEARLSGLAVLCFVVSGLAVTIGAVTISYTIFCGYRIKE